MGQHGIDAADPGSFVLLKGDQALFKSDAALELCRLLGGAWKMLLVAKIIPKTVRDYMYDKLARNRYQWFGKREQCMRPDAPHMDRFIE